MPNRAREDLINALYATRNGVADPLDSQFLLILALMLEAGMLRGYTIDSLRYAADLYANQEEWGSIVQDAVHMIEREYRGMTYQPQVEDAGAVAWVAAMRNNCMKLSRIDRALSHPSEKPSNGYPASICSLFPSQEAAEAMFKSRSKKDQRFLVAVPVIVHYADKVEEKGGE